MHKKDSAKRISKKPERRLVTKHDEYWKSGKGVAVCKKCKNILFKKEWHSSDKISVDMKQKITKFVICPACKIIETGTYEGEVLVKNIPENIKTDLSNLIVGFGKRAELRDPQDRIIILEKSHNIWRITTTENQLAVKLAKKIDQTFKASSVDIHHSKEPYEVARVSVSF